MNENECKAKDEFDCRKNREKRKCFLECGCARLFALKLRKLVNPDPHPQCL